MKGNKIIWAVDPFENRGALLKKTLVFLTHLATKSRLPVEPVYVVSPLELSVALEFSVPERDRFQTLALQQMDHFLKRINLPHLLPPKILIVREPSITACVKAFAKYAVQDGDHIVVAGTHAKKGMKRFVLGSFVETLLFCLKTPIILVNPVSKSAGPINKILFATDFSQASKEAFEKICKLASQIRSKLIIYHALSEPLRRWAIDTMSSITTEVQQREAEGMKLVQRAKKQGVKATVIIQRTPMEKYEAILAQGRKIKIDVLALAAQSGKMATTFLGSATRKVVRMASLPVWVYRSSEGNHD